MLNKFQSDHQDHCGFNSQELVYLGLGSNLGNRLENLREAINFLKEFSLFNPIFSSHVLETPAILLPESPSTWNLPYLNMVIAGTTQSSPQDLLVQIKSIEKRMGRNLAGPKWSPRIIDIDILSYKNQRIDEASLKIPHPEIKNREFLQYSLAEIGWYEDENDKTKIDSSKSNSEEPKNRTIPAFENFIPLNHFVLYPKFVGIVNVTPDSFSDGDRFLNPDKAVQKIHSLISEGASMIDLGAQSTRPGYKEISAQQEIARLSEVFEKCYDDQKSPQNVPISLDTYFDEVLEYTIKTYPGLVKCANVQQLRLRTETIKMLADNGLKIVIMLNGTDLGWFDSAIKRLENWGMQKSNIIIDPGIGFQKTKLQNIETMRNLHSLRQFGTEILLGHSRKSFISSFSKTEKAEERDIETIAVSETVYESGSSDYFRVHNVRDHMRFFVAKKIMRAHNIITFS